MRRAPLLISLALLVYGPVVSAGSDDSSIATRLSTTHWISYAPTHYYPAEAPAVLPSAASLIADLTTLRSSGFDGIITYGSDIEDIPDVAHRVGFRAMLIGIWNPWSPTERAAVLKAVIEHRDLIAGIIVGNEGILSGRYGVEALCGAMNDIGKETGKVVSTTEPVDWILGDQRLADCSGFISVNAHPYFSNHRTPVDAVRWTVDAWNAIRQRYPNKPTLFKEVGLPTGGADGLSEDGQKDYYRRLASTQVVFSYFEAFDADPRFKSTPIEQFWGLWRADRTPKLIVHALPWDDVNPYRCEGDARDIAHKLTLRQMKDTAEELSRRTEAVELCTAAELYKRLGDPKARSLYERAIKADEQQKQGAKLLPEPAYELFYGDYLRLYRGAGQRPLFPEAEQHLFRARSKLVVLQGNPPVAWPDCSKTAWNACTEERLQRSQTALYERDGVHLASHKGGSDQSEVSRPWLFFSPGVRLERSTDDFDQTSDIRDLTSAALFSENCLPVSNPARRLCSSLSQQQLADMARVETPMEADSTLRIRYESAPVIDLFGSVRRTEDGAINSANGFFTPDAFSNFKLVDFGLRIDKPFTITGTTDADLQFTYEHVDREGLIEFFPNARERIGQYQAYGSISHYLGPDRFNLSYTYVRQNINPMPYLTQRDRVLMGGTIDYQLFRPLPLPGRNTNTGLGRHFETRGIDLIAGFLNDHDHYTGPYGDVITRQDYFVGINARGFGPFDATLQPTWYSSRVSNDPTQSNSQFRMAGNVLARLVDEERTPGIPAGRFLGMPVAFVQIVIPFHWDVPRSGLTSFQSRAIGTELWAKFFTNQQIGVTVLGVVGYSRDWFPMLNKEFNLGKIGVSIGF